MADRSMDNPGVEKALLSCNNKKFNSLPNEKFLGLNQIQSICRGRIQNC